MGVWGSYKNMCRKLTIKIKFSSNNKFFDVILTNIITQAESKLLLRLLGVNLIIMELNKTSIEKIIKSFITEFNKLSDDNKIIIEPVENKIVAICKQNVATDPNLALLYENERIIFLDAGFNAISTYDKLLVVAASIKTHYQLTEGMITGYGHILYYELVNNSIQGNKILFGVDGKLMQDSNLNI
jgi:hypothetical protein